MGGVVFVIAAELAEHWQRAQEAGFWESTRRIAVNRGDLLVFWQAGRRELLGVTVATDRVEAVDYVLQSRPWLPQDRTSYQWRYRFEPVAGLASTSLRWPELMRAVGANPARGANTAPIVFDDPGSQRLIEALDLDAMVPTIGPSPLEQLVREALDVAGVPGRSTSYRPANEVISSGQGIVFERDPEAVDRGLWGHAHTQNAAAQWLRDQGITVRSPLAGVNFDLAWSYGGVDYVGEVKSLHAVNERHQLRLGIGQVLEFAFRLNAQAVLILEREPTSTHWQAVCDEHGIRLVWPAVFSRLISR